ncbi:MAG: ECF transporter S component [Defluviitaleaceae bacterium]|nr:ECF transporter S component [Defluviitaleaceae bacterium]
MKNQFEKTNREENISKKTKISDIKKLTALAMLTSMAFLVGALLRLDGVFLPHLTYDPKDVVILMGGFMFGPLSALFMSFVVAILEMSTVSSTAFYGALMNFLSSASFTCTAAIVYSKKRDIFGAIIGLAVGCVVVTVTMVAANVIIAPLFLPFLTPKGVLALLVLPVIVPFNLMKSSLNAVLAILVYKKVSAALKSAGLYTEFLPDGNKNTASSKRFAFAVMVVSGIIAVALLILFFLQII